MSQVLSESSPIARKQHRCDLCGLPIVVGEKYNRRTGVWDGSMATMKVHVACDEVASRIYTHQDDWESIDPCDFRELLKKGEDMSIEANALPTGGMHPRPALWPASAEKGKE